MIEAYKKYWKGYVDFSGISSRKEYWLAVLACIIVNILLNLIRRIFVSVCGSARVAVVIVRIVLVLYSLGSILPSIANMVRRLRDAGFKWTKIFFMFVPVAGPVIVLILLCQPTSDGDNAVMREFGDGTAVQDQQYGTQGQDALGVYSESGIKTVYCQKCSAPLESSAAFCTNCGAKVEK